MNRYLALKRQLALAVGLFASACGGGNSGTASGDPAIVATCAIDGGVATCTSSGGGTTARYGGSTTPDGGVAQINYLINAHTGTCAALIAGNGRISADAGVGALCSSGTDCAVVCCACQGKSFIFATAACLSGVCPNPTLGCAAALADDPAVCVPYRRLPFAGFL